MSEAPRQRKAKLTEGNINRTLFNLSLPMIWGIFAIMTMNLTDTFFVAKLGTKQLAAMSFIFPVIMVISSVALGLGIGTSSVISRAIGEGDSQKVRRLTTDSLLISMLIVGVLLIIGFLTMESLFTILGASGEIFTYIKDYMYVWYFGMLFLIVPMVGNSAIRATGDTLSPSMIMTLAALVNIVFDPIFIFGFAFIPPMAMQGAAVATVLSRVVAFIAAIYILHHREKMLDFSLPKLGIILKSWQKILYISLPAAGNNLLGPLSITIITAMIAKYGAESVAAFGIASRLEALSLVAVMGLSASMGPFVGQNWGARKKERVHTAVRSGFYFALMFELVIALLMAIFAGGLIKIFDHNLHVIAIASIYLYLVPLSYGMEGIRVIGNSTFNALGRPMQPTLLTICKLFVLYIPLALLFEKIWGISGIFGAAFLANVLVGLITMQWINKICHL